MTATTPGTASTSDARKRLAQQNGDHTPHHDPAVARLIEQARAEGAAEALEAAAAEASWMEYPASQDPRHWAIWLRQRAAALRGPR